ncbi:HAD-IIB family hydrolase [Povalibacter sp.]|uniref:HAD-IIB family hydrolase n=1 Tax=Povalibacter sp. TaxID=1962978 RepID=UPI002F414CC3
MKLIGIDVDGTLVGASGLVPEAVWQAADRARAAGIHLVLCSGRAAFGAALDYARRLDPAGWHAFQNGASVLDLASGHSRSVHLPDASLRRLITQARRTGEILELYGDREYAIESTAQRAREHAALLGVPFNARPFESLGGEIVRGQWLVELSGAEKFLQDTDPELEVAVSSSPLMPDTAFVGMTRAGVSKGSAMRAIAAEYGVDLRDTMYVGDADNDLPALKVVGHPLAMGNASPAVLAVATTVVGHVDAGGLAEALQWAIDRAIPD